MSRYSSGVFRNIVSYVFPRSHKPKPRDHNSGPNPLHEKKQSYYHVRFYCFIGIKFNCTDSANWFTCGHLHKSKTLRWSLVYLIKNNSIIDMFISLVGAHVTFFMCKLTRCLSNVFIRVDLFSIIESISIDFKSKSRPFSFRINQKWTFDWTWFVSLSIQE